MSIFLFNKSGNIKKIVCGVCVDEIKKGEFSLPTIRSYTLVILVLTPILLAESCALFANRCFQF